jgi:hypothetical protein
MCNAKVRLVCPRSKKQNGNLAMDCRVGKALLRLNAPSKEHQWPRSSK